MPSKYDTLNAVSQLEQTMAADLDSALGPRGVAVVHNGTAVTNAAGGRADIELRDEPNGLLTLVEATRRKGSAADGEFIAIADHLDTAVDAGGYTDYGCLFVSPETSARMSATLLERNRGRARDGRRGRIIAIDFATMEMLQLRLRQADPAAYPASRLRTLLERWPEATDDVRARKLAADVLFPEDTALNSSLTEEMRRVDAERELRLKKAIEGLEDKLRDRGITGNAANTTLIYLTFLRLYEEKRNRDTGQSNRFTKAGFEAWRATLPAATRGRYPNRLAEALLHEIAEDPELRAAQLLWRDGNKENLHPNLTDPIVTDLVLKVFDEYNFYSSPVDVLGVVFETLARRGEKDTRVGQFFTPQQVVDFGSDVIELRATDVVLDPAVGTSRFLIAAMRRQLERVALVTAPAHEVANAIRQHQLLGSDIDSWVATIAKMNMYVHGDGKSNMVEANGLTLADRSVFPCTPAGFETRLTPS